MAIPSRPTSFVGIDQGVSGAVVFLQPDGTVEKYLMPVMELGTKGKFIDGMILKAMLLKDQAKWDLFVVYEWAQKNPKFGTKTNWAQGFHGGTVFEVLRQNYIACAGVEPREWQKEMLKSVRTAGMDTKRAAELACALTFPGVSLLASPRCHKNHTGIADALLMAAYGRKHLFKKTSTRA